MKIAFQIGLDGKIIVIERLIAWNGNLGKKLMIDNMKLSGRGLEGRMSDPE